ncbi:MAG: transglutaminase domain-containing protein [Verrucomicrobia bacterium]|nr:transglutaminase domain-containing protein [Verrucomicrobiota bacterium]
MTLPHRKHLGVLGLLSAILLGANLYVFFMRDWESSFLPASYTTLNVPLDVPTVREWRIEDGHVLVPEIAWNRTPEKWRLLVDGKFVQDVPAAAPSIPLLRPIFDGTAKETLESFEHTYVLEPVPAALGPSLSFAITPIDAEFYRRSGMQRAKDIYIVHPQGPVGNYPRYPLSHWADDYHYIGAERLAAADRVVREQIGVKDSDDTMTRIEKVMRYLRIQLANSGGVPKDDFRWMDPWSMCQEMIAGTGKGWCTQNAQIYVFFANRAGVPTRFVFGANTQDDQIIYNGHSWAESWVKEQNRWTYVDMTQSLFGVADRHGQLLNTADLVNLAQHDAFEGITARIFKDWHWKDLPVEAKPLTPVTVPFDLVDKIAKQEYTHQAIIKYRHPPNVEDQREVYSMMFKDRTYAWTNVKRYLYDPPLAYSLLTTDAVRTYRVRQSLFAAWVLSVGLLLIAAARRAPETP